MQGFTLYTTPGYIVGPPHRVLFDALDQVIAGKIMRLMVFMPPQNGKSTIISKRFPAFVLGKKPDKFVISASYEQELATEFGGEVRNVVASQIYQNIFPGVDLREDSKAAGRWNTLQGGGYFAAGIGSGLAGRGGDLGIIDDPVKDRKAAESKVVREATKNWYKNVFYTRLHHPCPIIILMTRYHEDDLCGWLLKESGEEWKVLNLQAICETMPDPCSRQPGEALWPGKYPIETLKKIKKAIGEREFNSLYQGKPASLEGNILKRSQFRRYNERTCPELFDDIQGYIDANVSEGIDNDYFAISLWGMKGPKFYLLDLTFDILSMDGQLELSKAFIAKHPECRRWHFENKANGPAIVNLLSKEIPGLLAVEPASPLGNAKVQRAIAVQPFLASGDILIPETTPENMEWIDMYLTQCAQFPFGDHDDLVDVTTGPINWWKMNPLYGIGFGGDGQKQEEEDEQQV